MDEFLQWLGRAKHWFDLLLAIAFLYLFIAVEKLRTSDAKQHRLIEGRAKLVAGLAMFLILMKWIAELSTP